MSVRPPAKGKRGYGHGGGFGFSHGHSKVFWSRDPSKVNADWTFHLRCNSGKTVSFFVKTKPLEELPAYRLPYFEKVFKDKMVEIAYHESEIRVSDEVAKDFGAYLDFLYCKSEKEEREFLSNINNGQALGRIADYFKVKALSEMLSSFYQQATGLFTKGESKKDGKKPDKKDPFDFQLEQLALSLHMFKNFDGEPLLPDVLSMVLDKRKDLQIPTGRSESESISCLVAHTANHFKNEITKAQFYKITHKDHIPQIDQQAALQLLLVEADKKFWADTETFSSIQGRCIRSLLSDMPGFRKQFKSEKEFWKTMRRLSPNILGVLLTQSTGSAFFDESSRRSNPSVPRSNPSEPSQRSERRWGRFLNHSSE